MVGREKEKIRASCTRNTNQKWRHAVAAILRNEFGGKPETKTKQRKNKIRRPPFARKK